MGCPKCGNRLGFAFGTCIDCGYNRNTEKYDEIKVDTDILRTYLPKEIYQYLLEQHEKRTSRDLI